MSATVQRAGPATIVVPMSEVTDRIEAYAQDRSPEKWAVLRDWLTHHTFVTPQRYEPGTDPVRAAVDCLDWDHTHVDGSWDEVSRARMRDLLTKDEYLEVLRIIATAAGRG